MKKTLDYLFSRKKSGVPIVMLTAYDCPTAQIEDEAGVDAILVGDSVGTNVLGYASERDVTMADMLHHTAAVRRGVRHAFLLADMPYRSADTVSDAEKNAKKLLDAGAECVKIEGWRDKQNIIARLSKKKIPVCAHIGYNPQIHGLPPRIFGRKASEATDLAESAVLLQNAGAVLLILEKIPMEVAAAISKKLVIPVIGIGSGARCDGQVLVVNDLLGAVPRTFRHARRYMDLHASALKAVGGYAGDVRRRKFPTAEHASSMDKREYRAFRSHLKT
jgi:3-methyl-2-oxobutanoate hydroxymethyltransferase